MKIVIFDLDGTLTNLDHRLPLVKCKNPDWNTFFKRVDLDTPNEPICELIKRLPEIGYHTVILSGRPPDCLSLTKKWLNDYCIDPNELHLIGDKKNPDHELKRFWIKNYSLRDEVEFVIDDRQKVVDMWREEGFICLQCDAWKEFTKQF